VPPRADTPSRSDAAGSVMKGHPTGGSLRGSEALPLSLLTNYERLPEGDSVRPPSAFCVTCGALLVQIHQQRRCSHGAAVVCTSPRLPVPPIADARAPASDAIHTAPAV